jgi:hypothetical protein
MQQPDLVVERAAMIRLLAKAIDAGVELRGGCKLVDVKLGDKALPSRFAILIEAKQKSSRQKPSSARMGCRAGWRKLQTGTVRIQRRCSRLLSSCRRDRGLGRHRCGLNRPIRLILLVDSAIAHPCGGGLYRGGRQKR